MYSVRITDTKKTRLAVLKCDRTTRLFPVQANPWRPRLWWGIVREYVESRWVKSHDHVTWLGANTSFFF